MKDPNYASYDAEPEPKKRGCLFYGCITLIVLAVLVAIALFFVYRWIWGQVLEYTDVQPLTIPPVAMAQEERQTLKTRVDDFRQAVKDGKATEPLVLNSDELNALIEDAIQEQNPNAPEFKGRIHAQLEGDKIKGQVSIPLDAFNLKGRYFNGEADMRVGLQNGRLLVTVDSASYKGKPVPEHFMTSIRAENWAKGFNEHPENAELLNKLESIEVKDGKILITPKKPQEKAGEAKDEAKKEEAQAKEEDQAKAKDEAKAKDQDEDRSKDAPKADEPEAKPSGESNPPAAEPKAA